jgi:hypothetical protein
MCVRGRRSSCTEPSTTQEGVCDGSYVLALELLEIVAHVVQSSVSNEVTLVARAVITFVALERFLASVYTKVTNEVALASASVGAPAHHVNKRGFTGCISVSFDVNSEPKE